VVTGLLILGASFVFSATPQEPVIDLEARIAEVLSAIGAEAGIYFDSAEGRVFLWNADESFHAASTMKVPVMMEVFRQVESGKLRLDESLTIKNEFASLQDGSVYVLKREDDSDSWIYGQSGKALSILSLVKRMINRSSNLATNLLMERVSTKSVQELMASIDAQGMNVMRGLEDKKAFQAGRNNTTSARALAVCLKAILDPNRFQNSSRQAMLDILLSQRFNNGIPRGISARERGFKVAHKTGSISRISHDAAILEDAKGRRSILIVLTRGVPDEKQGEALVARLAYEVCATLLFSR
jgi:beta-lactamase class A